MAIDTRDKRAACLGFAFPPRAAWPNPDGSLADAFDRRHAAYSYPFESAEEPEPGPLFVADLDFPFTRAFDVDFVSGGP